MSLHLYQIGPDTVAAESPEDALRVVGEFHGGPDTDGFDGADLIPDDKPITVRFEDSACDISREPDVVPEAADIEHGDDADRAAGWHSKATAPAAEWAALGRRFVCSTEW